MLIVVHGSCRAANGGHGLDLAYESFNYRHLLCAFVQREQNSSLLQPRLHVVLQCMMWNLCGCCGLFDFGTVTQLFLEGGGLPVMPKYIITVFVLQKLSKSIECCILVHRCM